LEAEDPPPLPGVRAVESSAFTGTLRWRKPNAFGGIPSRPVEGEYDFLRGESTVDQAATRRRDNAILDAQRERDRLEAKRLAEERKKAVQDAMASIQNASRQTLPALIAEFGEKAAGDPAYGRLEVLAQAVLGDLQEES
jgi:hypothetical protein